MSILTVDIIALYTQIVMTTVASRNLWFVAEANVPRLNSKHGLQRRGTKFKYLVGDLKENNSSCGPVFDACVCSERLGNFCVCNQMFCVKLIIFIIYLDVVKFENSANTI